MHAWLSRHHRDSLSIDRLLTRLCLLSGQEPNDLKLGVRSGLQVLRHQLAMLTLLRLLLIVELQIALIGWQLLLVCLRLALVQYAL